MKWNYEQACTFDSFFDINLDHVESQSLNNIWAETKLKVDQQRPTKTNKKCKAKIRTLKDAYKKAKSNNVKTGAAPMACPFYNDIDEILGTKHII